MGDDLLHPKAAPVTRIKIWSSDGTVLYSDQPNLILKKFKLDPEQLDVLNSGATEGSVSDLRRRENKFETEEDGLLEVYTRIDSPEGKPLLFEAYYPIKNVQDRASEVLTPFRRISTLGLLAVLLLGVPMIWVLTQRLTRASRARERLMERAIDSSEAERRRIARDLHDGVVQELAGTAFALSGAAREPSVSTELRCRPGPRQRGPAPDPAPAEVAARRDPPAGTERQLVSERRWRTSPPRPRARGSRRP